MFLTEEQAVILLHDRSFVTSFNLTNSEIKKHIQRLKSSSKESVLMDTLAKLFYDNHNQGFYVISGGHPFKCDSLFMYDHLDILEDYYSWFLTNSNFENNAEELEKRKSAYKQYKLDRLRQVA